MYIEGKAFSLNHNDAALEKYNNRVRTTTRMTPSEMLTNTIKPIPNVVPNDINS